jgi:hypothetical protein
MLNLGNTLDVIPRILLYCYRPDAVASMYAQRDSFYRSRSGIGNKRCSSLGFTFRRRRIEGNPKIETCLARCFAEWGFGVDVHLEIRALPFALDIRAARRSEWRNPLKK